MGWTIASRTIAVMTLALPMAARSAEAQLWKRFVPVSHTEVVPQGDPKLSQENGPWLIMATSFQGDGAEQRARELVDELRERYRMNAYVHDRTFDFSEGNPGRGLNDYGAPVRTRYQREQAHEYAVLVGDFESIDDPDVQRQLDRVKSIQPNCLMMDDEAGSGVVRQFSNSVMDRFGRQSSRGPLAGAFLSRNPLLPREYFVPKGVDDFVAKMNQGVEHSLMECPGRYTVQVATFRGKTILQTTSASDDSTSGFSWKWRKDKKSNPLVEAAENAHLLAEKLREHGWEAYEFHDRTESIVTIGSFDQVAQRLPDGRSIPTSQVQQIVETFGALYDTPADPLARDRNDVRAERQLEEVKQQINQIVPNQNGQFATGMHPKHVKFMRGKNVERVIPMDVYPHTIEVPRRSVSSAYVGG